MAPWLLALGILTLLRLLVCGLAPLSADEAYYWVWSRALQPGYLDHPPMVALWIRAGSLLGGSGPLGVRLLGPLSAAVGTLALGVAAADLGAGAGGARAHGRVRRAIVACVLLNATLLLGVGSVTMTPDTPLLFFWTLALAALGRLLATGRGAWWLAAGVMIGLALDSKYTAVLPATGLACWLLATRDGRAWLRTPWPWLGGLLALALFAPVLAWNAGHGWASFIKQGGRTGAWQPARALRYLPELLGGQIGLATPLVFVLVAAGLAHAVRAGRRGDARASLLAWITLLPLGVFVQHALGDRVQANWPGLLYPAAVIAAAALVVTAGRLRFWRAAWVLGLALVLPVYVQAAWAPLKLPRHWDVTLQRLGGWQALARQADQAAGPAPAFLAADEYGLASELAHALPGRLVLGVEPRWRLFALAHGPLPDGPGLLLRTERRRDAPDPLLWSEITPVGTLTRGRGGIEAERYRLFRVRLRQDLAPDLAGQVASLPAP